MSDLVPVRRALLSVSDKTDLIPFAKSLAKYGVQLISTGGTAKALAEAGLEVTPIDEVTGFPEMMDGRVKTLHPRVHGGLLGLRDNAGHVASMKEHGIEPIDLVCVNLYPFERTIAKSDVADEEAIEQIDIGGPSMLRSASKNHAFVTVVTSPTQYDALITNLTANDGATSLLLRKRFAAAAFARTAAYDTAIAQWMQTRLDNNATDCTFGSTLLIRMDRVDELRYGENPHQKAALYTDPNCTEANVVNAKQLHGKTLSFNRPAASVIKHANPCGCGVDDDLKTAFEKAYAGDPMAAFGGIVALNKTVDLATAQSITEGQKFLEVIVAPGYDDDALALLAERWKNVRLLAVGPIDDPARRDPAQADFKRILGGILVQQRDLVDMTPTDWQHMAGPAPTAEQLADLAVAWAAVKHVKSNAITLAKDGALAGAGAGQMDRVESCKIAIEKANVKGQNRSTGSVAASDAFFPFRDGPDLLIAAGVKAIVQPGGSKRDDETISACIDAGVTLLFTGRRHFRH
jgi:phosphoribosylaminoimidazolecarboxamide formyltransferase/IMP cyclohydrolase